MFDKTEKALHAGNIAAAFGVVADVAFCGGLTTGIGAALSGHALLGGKGKPKRLFAEQLAAASDAAFASSGLGGDQRKIVAQMLHVHRPANEDFTGGDFDARKIAVQMRQRVEAEALDPAYKTPRALDGYEAVLRDTLAPVFANMAEIDPALQMATNAELLARTKELLELGRNSGQTDRLRDEGITEKAIIRLAQRIAGETSDLGQAWLELQNAMDIAVRVQEEGRVSSNHGDFVDVVLARVADLAKDGEYVSAGDAIDAALDEEEAAHAARKARLLDSGAEVALLAGDTERAADLLVRKADLDAGGRALFADLRSLQNGYYVEGRDKGLNLQLELSIDLAEIVLARAGGADERGTAGNELGISLQALGERESGNARLEAAVTAFEAALEEWTRERVPLDWAAAQMNLGNALLTLGQREGGSEPLEAAVIAYESALRELTRENVPLQWAMTQMNLGNALQVLGQRESDTERLEAAVVAYEAALEVWTLGGEPLNWAAAKMNMGTTLQTLGTRESGTARLEAAVAAHEAALEELTRERVPLDWAMTQMNRGTALLTLGTRESGTARLEAAIAAYEAALEEHTRERVPLQWAMTQGNLANVALAFFDKTGDTAYLDRALEHVTAARSVFEEAGASQYLGMAEKQIAEIQSRRPVAG